MSRGHGKNRRVVEKPKNFKIAILNLLKFLKPYRKTLILVIILGVISTVLSVLGPLLLGKITSQIQINLEAGQRIDLEKISLLGILSISLYGLANATVVKQAFSMNNVVQNISKQLRSNISKKINKLPLSYFDKNSYGEVLSRVTNDIDTVSHSLNIIISQIVDSITTIIATITTMLFISRTLTLIMLIFVPISFSIMALIVKFSQKYFKQQQANIGRTNSYIEEMYSGHNVIKVFNAKEKSLKEFNTINKDLYSSAIKSQFFSGLMGPVMRFFGNLSYLSVAVVGGLLALKGTLKIGDIQTFLIYARRFNEPISQIAEITSILQLIAAASERVFEFLDEEELIDETNKTLQLEKVKGKIEFKNVYFGYEKDKTVIKNLSFIAKPGQKIAIVGPTGAGKTTLVNLLMRFYEVDKGNILIDDVSISEMSRENVRKLFSMVLQDTWLFKGTIKENIIYGKRDASEEELIKASKTANAYHFIKTQPKGFDMILDENTSISQGQKQLITIARAMLENTPMLILDEATSSIDTRTENLIQEAMDDLMKNKTTFVIAHRLSTIQNADLILVIENGNIVEKGNHKQLLEQKGFYNELYYAQFENIEK